MTTPASGAISLNNIYSEFDGSEGDPKVGMSFLPVSIDDCRDHILGFGSGSVGLDSFYARTCVHGTSAGTIVAGDWVSASTICSTGASYTRQTNGINAPLKAKNWGFSVPSDKTIRGVSIQIQARYEGDDGAEEMWIDAAITKDGTNQAGNARVISAAYDPSTFTRYTYPWDSDSEATFTSLWGTTLSYSDVNSSNFGVILWATKVLGDGTNDTTVYVDHLRLRVHYS